MATAKAPFELQVWAPYLSQAGWHDALPAFCYFLWSGFTYTLALLSVPSLELGEYGKYEARI